MVVATHWFVRIPAVVRFASAGSQIEIEADSRIASVAALAA